MTLYSRAKTILETIGAVLFIALLFFIVPILFTIAAFIILFIAAWFFYMVFAEYNNEQEKK